MDEKSIERGLTCSTKGVASGEIPHASKKLGKSAREDGHPNYNIWSGDTTCNVFEDYTT